MTSYEDLPNLTSCSQETVQSNALLLKSWTWEEHGYNEWNAEDAIQLLVGKGIIQVRMRDVVESSSDDDEYVVLLKKYVSVPSIDMEDVPIQGRGGTCEDAECQCDLKILGELYRCEVIDRADVELNLNFHVKLPIPPPPPPPDDFLLPKNMQKWQEPEIGGPKQATSSNSRIVLPNTSQSQQSQATVRELPNFLNDIDRRNRNTSNGSAAARANVDSRVESQRYHPEAHRRKFTGQQPLEAIIRDQREMNSGPVRQANIEVNVRGGDGSECRPIRSFDDVKLSTEIRANLTAINFFQPTNLQKTMIPLVQMTDNDILCLAATGSGKSAAFLIPLIHRLQGLRVGPRGERSSVNRNAPFAVVVAHTKELVIQLHNAARTLATGTGVGVALARGQMASADLRKQLNDGCDILVVTPGKLDQFLAQQWIRLDNLEFLVIDEADKLIQEDDMANVLREMCKCIVQINKCKLRTIMLSATFNEVSEIVAKDMLRKGYYEVVAGNVNQVVGHVQQKIYQVDGKYGINPRLQMLRKLLESLSRKTPLLKDHFHYDTPKTLVFVNEARMSDRVAIALSTWGFRANSINGNRSMEQRWNAVEDFKKGKWQVLVGTDVLARGLNLPKVENVIMFELPPTNRYEQYIHRVGRTGRVGMGEGRAYVFFDPECRNDQQLAEYLVDQLRRSNQRVPGFLERIEREKAAIVDMLNANQRGAPNPFWNIGTFDEGGGDNGGEQYSDRGMGME